MLQEREAFLLIKKEDGQMNLTIFSANLQIEVSEIKKSHIFVSVMQGEITAKQGDKLLEELKTADRIWRNPVNINERAYYAW